MVQFFMQGGPFMWILLIMLLAIIGQAIRKGIDVVGTEEGGKVFNFDSIVWLGGISAAIGILGSLTGLYNAFRAISRASEISPPIIWMGLSEALTTTIFGLVIFIIAGFIRMALRFYGKAKLQ